MYARRFYLTKEPWWKSVSMHEIVRDCGPFSKWMLCTHPALGNMITYFGTLTPQQYFSADANKIPWLWDDGLSVRRAFDELSPDDQANVQSLARSFQAESFNDPLNVSSVHSVTSSFHGKSLPTLDYVLDMPLTLPQLKAVIVKVVSCEEMNNLRVGWFKKEKIVTSPKEFSDYNDNFFDIAMPERNAAPTLRLVKDPGPVVIEIFLRFLFKSKSKICQVFPA